MELAIHVLESVYVKQSVSTLKKTHWSPDKNTKRPFIHHVNLSAQEIVMWSCRSTGVVVYTLCNAYFQPSIKPSIEFGQLYLQNNLWLLGKCNGTGIHRTAAMASISISWYSTHDAAPSLADKILKTERGDIAALPHCHDEWVFANEARTHVVVIWISENFVFVVYGADRNSVTHWFCY